MYWFLCLFQYDVQSGSSIGPTLELILYAILCIVLGDHAKYEEIDYTQIYKIDSDAHTTNFGINRKFIDLYLLKYTGLSFRVYLLIGHQKLLEIGMSFL